jgi:regulator of sigma E protease
VGPVERGSFAANAGLRANDRIDAVADQPVATQEAAMLAILEDMIDDGKIHLRVAQVGEGERDLMIDVGEKRNSLTQPDALLSGLGFDFWSPPAVVGGVARGSSAERAGLIAGDKISSIDGKPVDSFLDMVRIVRARPDQNAVLAIERAEEHRNVPVHIAAEGSGDQRHGMIGIESIKPPQALGALQKYGPLAALGEGAKKTWETSAFTLRIFGNILTGHVSLKNISGPISIAEYTGMAAIAGWLPYLTMLALISISLGVLNLLPVPILDGGQIVYQLAELIKGSPVSEQAQLRGQQVGIVLLLLLMTLAFYNDIARHLG